MRDNYLTVGEGPQVPFVATPPDWTQDAGCLDSWELFDEPNALQFRQIVRPACLACPVFFACTATALLEETGDDGKPVGANFRAGIRGAMRPKDRAAVMAPLPEGECGRGHDVRVHGRFDGARGRWVCQACNTIRVRQHRQEGKAA